MNKQEASLYEATQKIKYLEMALRINEDVHTDTKVSTKNDCSTAIETVILCVYRTQRQCHKTVTVRGVTIPEGTNVVIPINVIHHMPQYWPDPYKFKPERYVQ